MKKVGKIILIVLAVLVSISLIGLIILKVNSPGKLNPLTDSTGKIIENSLSEKEWLEIGGIKQGFFIRSENPENPVILYLHGGPGSPELPLIEATEKSERLEKYFTVCYWNQRGAGMTYSDDTPLESITIAQFVEDTREMTEYLIKRFGKRKIYIMGHSWGSYLGVKTIEKYPEYYYAYVGIGQVTDQRLSEQLAHEYMMEHARQIDDKKAIKDLGKYNPNSPEFPTNEYLIGARISYMNKYGIGITHEPISMAGLFGDILMFKGYTMSDKLGYMKGSMFSLQNVFDYVIKDKLSETSTSFRVPVYVIHGKYDYQVSYELAKNWVSILKAPAKKLYTFENSAHSPNLEEQEKFVETVKEIASLHNDETKIEMKVTPNVFDSVPEQITYRITNYTNEIIEFGAPYTIDRYEAGQWVKVPFTDNLAFIQIMYGLQPGEASDYTIHMYRDKVDYPSGTYRINKQIYSTGGNMDVTAEFTIK